MSQIAPSANASFVPRIKMLNSTQLAIHPPLIVHARRKGWTQFEWNDLKRTFLLSAPVTELNDDASS
jgi:hypothetical protein